MTCEHDLWFCVWLQLLLVATWESDLLFFLLSFLTLVPVLCKKHCCRTADTIVSWLEKKTGPPALALASVEEATAFDAGKL